MASAQTQQVPVGTLYGLPGFTENFEQFENVQNVTTTLSQAAQTPFNPPNPFVKTDIVMWWEYEMFLSFAITYGSGVLVNSPEAPYNLLQGPQLKLQGQYTPQELDSGFHGAFMQMFRPMRMRGQRNVQDLIQAGPQPTTAYANALIPQANLAAAILASSYTSPVTISSYPMILEAPAGIFLDEYWDLALDGTLLPNARGVVAPMAAFVSPQYMAGGERNIQPKFNYAASIAATYDQGPFAATTALGTVSGYSSSVLFNARRVGVYASDNPGELPPIFNWQYRRASRRVNVGSFTKVDIPLPEYGQYLSTAAIIFDPSLGTNSVGGYYNMANITKCQLLYGSNIPRFDDDMPAMQKRFIEQHGFLPPQGTVVWDLAASRPSDKLTNARALNTMTNANTHIHLECSSAPGTSTYVEILSELLVPVSTQ
jgi:hypothetical protein